MIRGLGVEGDKVSWCNWNGGLLIQMMAHGCFVAGSGDLVLVRVHVATSRSGWG